jgi:hypothetical protein|tara:strand:- start:81 stop:356 length:276 start_codon:yes stop_codon:yes gene_type:complete
MSEPIKFTKDELDKVTKLRDQFGAKVNEFGQLELELLLTSQRIERLAEAKTKLQEDYLNLQKEEGELVKGLNEKYGAGTVDLQSGEFIPAS